MRNLRRIITTCAFMLSLMSIAYGQGEVGSSSSPSAPTVTATVMSKRVRFVAPGAVVQLRLEVYTESGQKVFDTELRGGNVLDWSLQDGTGESLPSGSYACVLTTKSLSGKLSQRVGLVTVGTEQAEMRSAEAAQLSSAQQQAVGPIEGTAGLTVLEPGKTEAMTMVAHDDTDGQLSRTRGALSFRLGDFLSGKDAEQMRLTEEGNLGIGTDNPQAKLDVNGVIRARQGIQFDDGSLLNVSPKGGLKISLPNGKTATADLTYGGTNVSGTGTANKVTKWTDNAGTLGDSAITEVSGNVGIGLTNPSAPLHIFGSTETVRQSLSNTSSYVQFAFFEGAVKKGAFGYQGSTSSGFVGGPSAMVFGTLTASPVAFFTNGAEKVRLDTSGNFGIGTTNPNFKLDVAGNFRSVGSASNDIFVQTTGGTNTWARLNMQTANQNWVLGTSRNFNGDQFYLFDSTNNSTRMMVQPGTGPIAFPNSNVGIGLTQPPHRLSISGGPTWTSNAWTGSVSLDNGAAIGWNTNAAGNHFGIGQTGGGLYFFHTSSNLGSNAAPANYDLILDDGGNTTVNGNVSQPRDKSGFPKAMIFVKSDGTVLNCYNGINSNNCFDQFKVTVQSLGRYLIDFGFQITDRFLTATSTGSGVGINLADFGVYSNSSVVAETTYNCCHVGDSTYSSFMIIVY